MSPFHGAASTSSLETVDTNVVFSRTSSLFFLSFSFWGVPFGVAALTCMAVAIIDALATL